MRLTGEVFEKKDNSCRTFVILNGVHTLRVKIKLLRVTEEFFFFRNWTKERGRMTKWQ